VSTIATRLTFNELALQVVLEQVGCTVRRLPHRLERDVLAWAQQCHKEVAVVDPISLSYALYFLFR
jgi:hypothetical protein